jgi:beta-galactosidase
MKTLPEQIISGAMHYFRVHPKLWDDRLDKAVALGLNTIETYVPWNLHEPHQDEYCFEGICDIKSFILKAQERQLNVIVRPGPYICAEFDNGGLPGWLVGLPKVKIRCFNQVYLDRVEKFYTVLFDILRPLLVTNGGPIIMMQIENEYGSYGNDKKYLNFLVDLYKKLKMDVPYFTSDGPSSLMLAGGTVKGITPTVNFGMNNETAFATLKKFEPTAKEFCMEFWDGWFDHWGEKHQLRPAEDGGDAFASEYEKIIARGASCNLYMYHGGTNFGFTAGANGNNYVDYAPIVTSYDYDCTLSEAGDPTEKFIACQRILKKYTNNPRIRPIEKSEKIAPQDGVLTQCALLTDNIKNLATKSGQSATPPTLEELGENFGFIHYSATLPPFEGKPTLRLIDVNDYAQVWLDGKYLGKSYRKDEKKEFAIEGNLKELKLELVVENMGRINYGPYVGKDFKGIAGSVGLGFQTIFNWEYNLMPLNNISNIDFNPVDQIKSEPAFYKGTFTVDKVADTFLMRPGSKGTVFINGFNLGRYWSIGPTETLYVPSAILKQGENEIVIFEQEKLSSLNISFSQEPNLGEIADKSVFA